MMAFRQPVLSLMTKYPCPPRVSHREISPVTAMSRQEVRSACPTSARSSETVYGRGEFGNGSPTDCSGIAAILLAPPAPPAREDARRSDASRGDVARAETGH